MKNGKNKAEISSLSKWAKYDFFECHTHTQEVANLSRFWAKRDALFDRFTGTENCLAVLKMF